MKYRTEIDGLRAVAVLPVIFFHAGFAFFSGGYIGVDVFFVISGYLITTIILGDIAAGKFTFSNFYERRARRIIPALIVVMLVCVPFAYYWMLPRQLTEFSQSLIAVSLFGSNILFWLQTGYFATASDLKPLLHTWSLAVEEQYYLFFPLLIIFISRFGRRVMLAILVLLGLVSILFAQFQVRRDPDFAFYLILTRLWEILIGSFVSIYLFQKPDVKFDSLIEQALSMLGLVSILYAVIAFNDRTPFPSFYTLVPTLGTALIILFASRETFAGKFLSNKLLVGVGLISYSAYLWHQPIFVFARLISIEEPNEILMLVLSFLTLALAYLTWKYIETPFRNRSKFDRNKIFLFSGASSFLIVVIGGIGVIGSGFGYRIAPNGMYYSDVGQVLQENYGLNKECDYKAYRPFERYTIIDQCRTGKNPKILIWGDSFAMQLVPGILASQPNAKIIQMTKSGCGSIIAMQVVRTPRYADDCINFNNDVVGWLKSTKSIRYVVMSSRLSYYLDSENYIAMNNKVVPVDKKIVLTQMEETLALITSLGKTPIFFGPLPTNGKNIGNCLIKKAFYLDGIDCRIETVQFKDSLIPDFLKKVEIQYPVIWLSDAICDDRYCYPEMDGVFLYRDEDHLSIDGSVYLGKKLNFYHLITSR